MKKLLPLFLLLLLKFSSYGQLSVTQGAAMNMSPMQFVQTQIVGQGVTVLSAYIGENVGQITSNQYGTFTAANSAYTKLGLNAGVIFSTGNAIDAIGPNLGSNNASASLGGSGDPDLTMMTTGVTHDAAVIEFTFIPMADTLKFKYVFGSEEFYEYCSGYNDVFGFFLSGPGIAGPYSFGADNIALMPNSSNAVSIFNLCADPSSNWDNTGGTELRYDGLTYVFTAWHLVQPCQVYRIKLAIADVTDFQYDSGVFIEKNSFSATGFQVNTSYSIPGLGPNCIEGCSSATVSFKIADLAAQNDTIHYTLSGSATNGIDFPAIPSNYVVIPAGQDSVYITISPVKDGITEGNEYLIINIPMITCSGTTILTDSILIIDNSPLVPQVMPDTGACEGAPLKLSALGAGGRAPYSYLWNTGWNKSDLDIITLPGVTPYWIRVKDACGDSVKDTIIVTGSPQPVISNNPLVFSLCSQQTTNIAFQSTLPGTTYFWTASSPSPNVSGFASGSGGTISQQLFNTGTTTDTVYYTVTPNSSGCFGPLKVFKVAVLPLPQPVLTGPSSVCKNQTGAVYSTQAGKTNYIWNVTGGTVTAGGTPADNSVTVTWTTAGAGSVSVIYTDLNLCTPVAPTTYNVTVKPLPDVIFAPAAPSICGGQTTNISLSSSVTGAAFSWTATGSSPNISGYGPGSGSVISQTLTENGTVTETVTYHVTPVAASCSGAITDVTVTVNPKPHLVTNPLNQTICSEATTNVNLVSSCPGTIFNWTPSLISGNVTGYSAGTGPNISQVLTNTLATQGEVKYTVSFGTGTCIGNDTSYFIYINPKPHVLTQHPDTAVCSSGVTAIHLTSDISGSTFTWTAAGSSSNVSGFSPGSGNIISQTLVNSGFTDDTVTYTIIPQSAFCTGFSYTFKVIVHPVPDVYFTPSSQIICSGGTTGISLQSHVSGASFSWTTAGNALLTGFSNGSGNSISQTLSSTASVPENITYMVTPVANSCSGNSTPVTITVNPVAHVTTNPDLQSACSGSSFIFNLNADVTGTSFTWTAASTTPLITGFTSGSGALISQTLTNTGYDIDSVIYTVIPTANGCNGISRNYYAVVKPIPDLSNNPPNSQICSGNNTNVNLTSHVTGSTFSWTCTGTANVTGYTPGSGTAINQVLTNTGLNQENVVYHVVPSANGCSGPVTDYTVFIAGVPDVYFNPPAQTICSTTSCNISVLSHVTGTTFSWTAAGGSPNVTGFSAGSGSNISQNLINSGNNFETVTYTVTPVAAGCPPGQSQNVAVIVNPKPAVTNSSNTFSICSSGTTNISLTSSLLNSTFTWTATGSSPAVSGYSPGSGPLISQVLINTGSSNETVTYTVTPRANNCDGDPFPFTVTVFPFADVVITPATQAFCTGNTTSFTLNSGVAGASFSWSVTGSSPNVSGYLPGNGTSIQQTLLNSGSAIETVKYIILPSANGCSGRTDTARATVYPKPAVNIMSCFDLNTTTVAKPLILSGGIPAGGTWSGTGITGSTFDPSVSGAGTFILTYTYINTWGCNNLATTQINVTTPAAFTCGNTLTDIRDNSTYPTVLIGSQCWMASNLNFGTSIPENSMQRNNCITEKYCTGSCSVNGGYYQWDEIMNYSSASGSKGICPPEWHVPSEIEWNILFANFVDAGFAGSPLKFTGFTGFNALLAGNWYDNSLWKLPDFSTMFWTSDSHGIFKAWAHGMNKINPSVSTYPANRSNAFPVRCIKD